MSIGARANHLVLVAERAGEVVLPQESVMSALEKIQATRQALETALVNEDWEAVTALDLDIRACLDGALADKTVDAQLLRENLEGLLVLYRQLVDVTSRARQSIASEMTQAKRGYEAAKVYNMARRASFMR